MKRRNRAFFALLAVCLLLFSAGCAGTVSSDQITRLDQAEETDKSGEGASEEKVEPLQKSNALPEDGVISQAQLETIAGKEGTYEFWGEDSGIIYTWIYEGKKIQNAIEQKMKVSFTEDQVEKVKKLANQASVGLGITLDEGNLAAPAKLELKLSEKWDADTAILCKLVDGEPQKMADVQIKTEKREGQEVSVLTFSVTEMGDTYYLVGGKSAAENSSTGTPTPTPKSAASNTGTGSSGGNDTGTTVSQGSQEVTSPGNEENAAAEEGNVNSQSEAQHTCTISIDCLTILDNLEDLNTAKSDFVPADGWILYSSTVEYTPGETVYDVLYRVCQDAGIQMEASFTPMYGSYYVEGINQLYEFDCGELSGWMYNVNGWYPNYGCSKYEVSDGDVIEWRYTCDLGRDVGEYWMGE